MLVYWILISDARYHEPKIAFNKLINFCLSLPTVRKSFLYTSITQNHKSPWQSLHLIAFADLRLPTVSGRRLSRCREAVRRWYHFRRTGNSWCQTLLQRREPQDFCRVRWAAQDRKYVSPSGKSHSWLVGGLVADHVMLEIYWCQYIKQSWILFNPYPTAFPYGNGMVQHFYQQQESSTTKTVHKVINKGLKAYV